MKTTHFTAVFETEDNGTISAWIVGVSGVYAAADTLEEARVALVEALDAHLVALLALGKSIHVTADTAILRCEAKRRGTTVAYVGAGALLGRARSRAKGIAARKNGQKGGRPKQSTRP
jgi:predicted RNase H-like HicB family nuclease